MFAEPEGRVARLERKIGQQQIELDFFGKPAAGQGSTPANAGSGRDGIYAVIQEMTSLVAKAVSRLADVCALCWRKPGRLLRHWADPPRVWKKPRCGRNTQAGAGAPALRLSPDRRATAPGGLSVNRKTRSAPDAAG